MRRLTIFLTILLAASALAGCGVTQRRALSGSRDSDQVWTAMKAVANEPDYMKSANPADRWVVRQNEVTVDDVHRLLHVYRRLEREVHAPLSPPHHETREWKFEIALEQPMPPIMLFRTNNAGVPAHAWDEAKRYFDEVEQFLGPLPGTATAPATSAPQQ